jgi:hypothetical protein
MALAAGFRRREERQPQAVRHLVIRRNGGSSNNTDLPAGTSASASPAAQKTPTDRRCRSRPPGIGRKNGLLIDAPRTVAEKYPAAPAAVKSRRPQRVDQTAPRPERPPRIEHHSGRPMTRKLEGALGRPDDD